MKHSTAPRATKTSEKVTKRWERRRSGEVTEKWERWGSGGATGGKDGGVLMLCFVFNQYFKIFLFPLGGCC